VKLLLGYPEDDNISNAETFLTNNQHGVTDQKTLHQQIMHLKFMYMFTCNAASVRGVTVGTATGMERARTIRLVRKLEHRNDI
jgi:hypothetical protein